MCVKTKKNSSLDLTIMVTKLFALCVNFVVSSQYCMTLSSRTIKSKL